MTKGEMPQKRTDDSQFRCTVCGRIGTVGRCCGLDTREPLNDLARAELAAEEQRKANAAHPKAHNHIWREGTPMPTEEKSKDALLASIIRCGTAGRWLRGEEIAWGAELEAEGKVSLCCGGEAAMFFDVIKS